MRLALLAVIGGAAGTLARYVTITTAAKLMGTAFPWGTLTVNVVGSFAIGVLMAIITFWYGGSSDLRAFLVTGFLGGFTTFSAYSFDIFQLIERRAIVSALLYAIGSVVISLLATYAGFAAMKAAAQ